LFEFLFKLNIDNICSDAKVRPVVLLFSNLMEHPMVKNLLFAAALASTSIAFATNAQNAAVISDKDEIITVTVADNTWAVVATNSTKGLTKLREFHDMGDAGVQQIDYVVNCNNRKLSMADFKVLTAMSPQNKQTTEREVADLSFYQPVIQHDINIVENVCGGKLAMGKATSVN
jgi:hypothetical protein